MPAYLMLWDGTEKRWKGARAQAEAVMKGKRVLLWWITGRRKNIPKDSAVYIKRTGARPRGIVASGRTIGPVESDAGKNVVEIRLDGAVNPFSDGVLPQENLGGGVLDSVNWNTQGGGMQLSDAAAKAVERLWRPHLDSLTRGRQEAGGYGSATPDRNSAEAEAEELSALEGERRQRMMTHLHRERAFRNRKLKQVLRETGALRCEVRGCGFDFAATYGALGKGYAHVHHRRALSERGVGLTKLKDLAVVCPNCHAMLHVGGKSRPVESLSLSRRGAR